MIYIRVYCGKHTTKNNKKINYSKANFIFRNTDDYSLINKEIVWGYEEQKNILAFKTVKIGRKIIQNGAHIKVSIPYNIAEKTAGLWKVEKKNNIYYCHKENENLIMYKNLLQKRFGKLTAEKYLYTDKSRSAVWLCKCDCGNEVQVKGSCLISGHTKSCGCLQKEIASIKYNNRANNVLFNVNGEILSMSQISRKYNINLQTLSARLHKYNFTIEEAIKKPVAKPLTTE